MRAIAGALTALLALPAAASADVTIQAVDAPANDPQNNLWAPRDVTIKVGESVSWSFAGTTLLHNVQADPTGTPWEFKTPYLPAGPTATRKFDAPGTYKFLCDLHKPSMVGTVTVTDEAGTPPPPPPPPPLSEQPFGNDTPTLTVFEKRDTVAPKLDRVKVSRVARGLKVGFRLSEAGKITVTATRGRSVTKRTIEVAKGPRSVTLRGLKAGRYRVQVSATDLAGNAAKSRPRAGVTVRR
jgi:plastocyanin